MPAGGHWLRHIHLQRTTAALDSFDGFAMFHPKENKLIWASNRNAKSEGDE